MPSGNSEYIPFIDGQCYNSTQIAPVLELRWVDAFPPPQQCLRARQSSSIATSGRSSPTAATPATGPTRRKRKSKLRLDTEAGAKADLGGHFGIVPGDPPRAKSCADHRRTKAGACRPPGPARHELTEREIDLLTRWVEQGAEMAEALVVHSAASGPSCPKSAIARWPKNPIDTFVLARLEREGLKPRPKPIAAR